MVQAVITLGEDEDRILNIVKGKFGLKNKSEAVNRIIDEYGREFLEPELRPEYLERLKGIREKGKFKEFSSVEELVSAIESV